MCKSIKHADSAEPALPRRASTPRFKTPLPRTLAVQRRKRRAPLALFTCGVTQRARTVTGCAAHVLPRHHDAHRRGQHRRAAHLHLRVAAQGARRQLEASAAGPRIGHWQSRLRNAMLRGRQSRAEGGDLSWRLRVMRPRQL
eukprot:2722116-Rhodomonas_salina.2